MPFDAAFTLGPFTVDDEGRLAPSSPEDFPAFQVTFRDRVVRARLTRQHELAADGGLMGMLALQATLARVPSSAGSGPERTQARPPVFAALRWLPRTLPPGWRVALLADHRFMLFSEAAIALPASASELVAAVTSFLLDLAPYLDLIDEGGLGEAAA